MKLSLLVAGMLCISIPAFAAMPAGAAVSGDTNLSAAADPVFAAPGSSSQFQISDNTQVPGHILKAGSYTITVVDHLSDRMVLRISGEGGKEQTTFLALPGKSQPNGEGQGPISMSAAKGKPALKGFVFPNGAVAEFVYPKEEAVALAKANSTTVPAIDPASEGRKAGPGLSRTDMELVTLWMLTPTVVGPNSQAGIEAKRYQPEVAEATAPPPPPAPARTRSTDAYANSASTPAAAAPVAKAVAPASPKPRAVAHPIGVLPHTASDTPLIALFGGVFFFAALGLGIRRKFQN